MEQNKSGKIMTEKSKKKQIKIEFLTALLADMGSEVRSRREPESILTAAFVAAAGAAIWGVAALNIPAPKPSWWCHPAIVGAIGIVILSIAVVIKIIREYITYKEARMEQGIIANKIIKLLGEEPSLLPKGLANAKARSGHRYSVGIVIVAGLAAVCFCLSIYFK